ncbi:MAG: hypothetical protein ACLRWQ_12855 [Flavonifractor plautii]
MTRCFCAISPAEYAGTTAHVDLERMGKYRRCAQFFALFGEPEPTPVRDLSGKTHRELFLEEYALFEREMAANADLAAFCRTGAEGGLSVRRRAAFLSRWRGGAAAGLLPGAALEEAHAMGFETVNPHGTTSTLSPARMQRSRSGG